MHEDDAVFAADGRQKPARKAVKKLNEDLTDLRKSLPEDLTDLRKCLLPGEEEGEEASALRAQIAEN